MINSELYSLLFQSAVYHAMKGRRVTFVCDPEIANEERPKLSSKFDLKENQGILKRIEMKYCGNMFELCQFLTHFHLYGKDEIPQILIIHDMVRFLEVSMFTNDSESSEEDDSEKEEEEEGQEQEQEEMEENDDWDGDSDCEEDNDSEPDQMDITVDGEMEQEDGEEQGGDDEEMSEFKKLELELKMNLLNEEKVADFLDDQGRLEYDHKLAAFLPVLCQTQDTVARIVSRDGNHENEDASSDLQEMICIIGMECLQREFDGLYPLWRRWGFERFLRCKFKPKSNAIRIEYDTEDGQNEEEDDDDDEQNDINKKYSHNHSQRRNVIKSSNDSAVQSAFRCPASVHCYVGEHTMDIMTPLAKRRFNANK